MTALTLEIRKYQNSRLSFVVLGLAGFLTLWLATLVIIGAARAIPGPQTTLTMALYNFVGLTTLLMGPAVAILAGRVAGVDQEERMGQLYRALGQSPLQQFLIKLTLLTILAGFMNFSMLLVGITVGAHAGLGDAPSYGASFWPVVTLTLAATLAVSAVQLALATIFDQPSAGVVVGIAGSLVATFTPFLNIPALGWALPWGLTTAATPYLPEARQFEGNSDFLLVETPGLLAGIALIVAIFWTAIAAWLTTHMEEKS